MPVSDASIIVDGSVTEQTPAQNPGMVTAPGYAPGASARTTTPGTFGGTAAAASTSTVASTYTVVPNPYKDPTSEHATSATRPGSLTDDDSGLMIPGRLSGGGALAFWRTPRGLAIIGGAVVVIVILLVALGGGKKHATNKVATVDKKKSLKVEPKAVETTPTPTDTDPAGTDGSGGESGTTGTARVHTGTTGTGSDATETSGSGSGSTPDTGSAAEPTNTGSAAPPPTGTTPKPAIPKNGKKAPAAGTLGGKQVVLEYDNQAREAASVPNTAAKGDQNAISKARNSYAAGNQRLFAGDADGAIRYYKQALGYYPAYVAGYRGLGLAYSQQGNKPAALQAFRTYVSSVPTAKDTPLIRKRITTLQPK